MTFIDLFAGIGGFRRGMELAGHKCTGFCEWDKFAAASYTAMHLMTEDERENLKRLPFNKRYKEALREECRHGEWYAADIRAVRAADMPRADCWCFGFPCQDISVAGKQRGLAGRRSGLFHTVIKLLEDTEEENKPDVLFIENVKNLLSVNRGYDFLTVLTELDKVGYDAEWQVINSAGYVPQNRERVFIVGHLRGRGGREVFPVGEANRKNTVIQIGNCMPAAARDNPNQGRIYDKNGISPCLNKMDGGGREPLIEVPKFCDISYGAGINISETAFCLQARYNKGVTNRRGEHTGVVIPVSSPDRVKKKQNGRRFKDADEQMFTLTSQDRHGIYNGFLIRKLTPKECFRLQGWEDKYFERAALVNSDSQLYKQAGNGVTVPVIYEIAGRL